jgi:serine/threonine protein kinase/class 3 adenylate cyclase
LLTIVFTDLVDSVALRRQLGDQASTTLMQAYRRAVRTLLQSVSEAEEVETAGDSFLLLFARPSDAVRFTLVMQRQVMALAQEQGVQLLDRVGVHVGEVVIEEHAQGPKPKDLYGSQVDLCARLMGLAQGGQVLLTRAVFDNARQALRGEDLEGFKDLQWLNHGPYLLKGIEEPIEICEVGEVGIAVLSAPPDGDKAHRKVSADAEPVLGWRPAVSQAVPNTQWVLERKLGEGGFGEVWLGRHTTLKERRVFKFCFRADRVRSLKREVTLFRLLRDRIGKHPNIVGVLEVDFEKPPFYIVMDYAEELDLKAWCDARGGVEAVPMGSRLEIVAQIAAALQTAHGAGVIHRDVKPSNILISESKSPTQAPHLVARLTDFGIGQVVSEETLAAMTQMGFTQTMFSTSSSSHTGTQLYMAPELLVGQPASPQSDIYSLGVVFYQLAVGDLSTPVTTDWAKRIPDTLLREDLEKCFAGNPRERFASAGALAQSLRSIEQRQAELAQSRERAALQERSTRRRKAIWTAVGAIAAITLIGWLAVTAFHHGGPPVPRESTVPSQSHTETATALKHRKITVWPFESITTNEMSRGLAAQLTEELNSKLSQIADLTVIDSTLTSGDRNRQMNPIDWGRQYELDAIITGSVTASGDQLLVRVKISALPSRQIVWEPPEYQGANSNIFQIQSEIALKTAEVLRIQLQASEKSSLERPPTDNPEAYKLYGKALALVNEGTDADNPAVIALYQDAIRHDTNFALAYLGLARVYASIERFIDPGHGWDTKALSAIEHALESNSSLAGAHIIRGELFYSPRRRWDAVNAVRELRQALAINRNSPDAHENLGFIYFHQGFLQEAVKEFNAVTDIAPSRTAVRGFLGQAWLYQGNYARAHECLGELDSDWNSILNLYYLGEIEKAKTLLKASLDSPQTKSNAAYTSLNAVFLAGDGKTNEAKQWIDVTVGLRENQMKLSHFHHASYQMAEAYAMMNDKTNALNWLSDCAADGFPCFPYIKNDPNLIRLKGWPPFTDFVDKQERDWKRRYQEIFAVP